MKTSDLAMTAGSDSGTVLFHWDLALSSETVTHASDRIPSLAADTYNNKVRCLLESRSGPSFNSETDVAHLGPGEVVLLLNGGRHSTGLTKLLQTPWSHNLKAMTTDRADDVTEPVDQGPPPPVCHNIMVVKDLKSMQARHSLNRHSLCGLNQVVGTLTWTIKISCLGFGPPLELLYSLFRQCHHFSCQLSEFGPGGTIPLTMSTAWRPAHLRSSFCKAVPCHRQSCLVNGHCWPVFDRRSPEAQKPRRFTCAFSAVHGTPATGELNWTEDANGSRRTRRRRKHHP